FQDFLSLKENDIVLIKGGISARMEQVVGALLADSSDVARLVRQDEAQELPVVSQPASTTWVEIDQSAIAHNVRQIRQLVGDSVCLMAVVKGDAYGHGAVASSITALANGAE